MGYDDLTYRSASLTHFPFHCADQTLHGRGLELQSSSFWFLAASGLFTANYTVHHRFVVRNQACPAPQKWVSCEVILVFHCYLNVLVDGQGQGCRRGMEHKGCH